MKKNQFIPRFISWILLSSKMSETETVEKKLKKKTESAQVSSNFWIANKLYDIFGSVVPIPNECQHKFISFSMQVQMSSHYLCQ